MNPLHPAARHCPQCGHAPLEQCVPPGDTHMRLRCPACAHLIYDNPRVIAGAIIDEGGRIALCQRGIPPGVGRWTLPAGFMEHGESVEEAAAREVMEETGMRVEIRSPYSIFSVPPTNEIYLIYRATLVVQETEPGPESLQVQWFGADDLPWQEIFYPAIGQILTRYFDEGLTGRHGVYSGSMESGHIHFIS
ncbi:NUDIX hydrolase [Salinicola sp. JS01]|uniref:NUDIX hydrolase n=1 Tax=Salinicola sp. JS01 TaxID=3050071 RepID=UPI00255B8ACF|nr:NUDIX hydrolase [Salinicola sp. JS01]WIX32316.1 NUDIX hydrolase [Salinicola sp. JS01]